MHIPTKKSNKKIFVIIASAALLLLAATSLAYYFKVGPFAQSPNGTVNLQPATDEEKKTGSDTKQQSIDQVEDEKNNIGSDPSPAPQPINDSNKKSVGMEITAANQNESILQVRTLIQTITNSGTCTISMKNAQGATYSENAGVQASSSTTTCKGFDIPLSQLAPGTWTIALEFHNDDLTASTSKEITIQ